MADSHSNENTCVVCFKNVLYYSIGECDHPVCFECSTRMRVLCLQNECPICRQDLARVVFTATVQPYKELRNIVFTDRLFDRQFKIGYCTEEIKQAYDYLLENRCKLCEKIQPFRNFGMLSDHMRKVHERHFCDLCVKHLRIFTSERKCYTRQELAHHRRKGDLDDTSHRGHPLCEFCEERFMDADELYRHLRKEHLYCHLCDADGRNLYYASHAALAHHFRTDHYLCEEGECAGQHLTAVFRSDIDLKAHKATVHGRGMARGAARQARTLELQFNITPHPVGQRTPRERERAESSSPPPAVVAAIDTRSDAHFPRLSAAPPAHNLMLTPAHKGYRGGGGLARTDKNFPALDGAGRPPPTGPPPTTVAATILRNSKPSVSIQLQNQGASASSFRLTQTGANSRISHPPAPARRHPPPDPDDYPDDFPSLSARDDHPSIGAAATQPPKVAMINSQEMQSLKGGQTSSQKKKPQLSAEAFPALSAGAAPPAPPQWITVPRARDKRAPKQPPPAAPAPAAPAFPPRADFPTLPANTKAKKAAPAPVLPAPRHPLTQPNDNSKPTKKEKKKQNNKKENQATIEANHWNGSANTKNLRDLYINADHNNIENGESVEVDKKIKTVESPPSAVSERSRNGGNGDFALASHDYPPLSASKRGPIAAQDYPPLSASKSGPPAAGTVAPPPGFRARAAFDGMTFTNSAGQTFSAPVHAYIPPPDFEPRNRLLVRQFAEALGGAAAVEQFKVASRAFRDGCISASEFHGHCRAALGGSMDLVFPELVALLPDISKQQELALASGIALAVCHTCGQLLAPTDLAVHERAHWPELATR